MSINSIGYNQKQYAFKPEINREAGLIPSGAVKDNKVGNNTYTDRNEEVERAQKKSGIKECRTCKERKYQDASNDPGVSFKSPAHVSPGLAGAAVAAHENEHVAHEQARAREDGREILYQSVQIYTSTCPECGKVYVSGGKTTTVTGSRPSREINPGLIVDQYV